ncbi:hypothetical protein PC116_g13168 [Phytophthora cactorum]|nr:hypothetical protein Pcac1_g22047 [Phytophthora cactorum]KAG4050740.1 hypothetical protein PC123_g14026 [Phytophthora cactorum]KAG4238792.1 hypothetical protein PC116_g13168 [Phytophthora cactorum]
MVVATHLVSEAVIASVLFLALATTFLHIGTDSQEPTLILTEAQTIIVS